MVGLPSREAFDRNAGTFQDGLEALCLRAGVRMICHVQDEKRWNALVLRYVIDRGVVAVFRRIIPEFFAVTPFRLRQTMHPSAGFSCLNDRGHIVRVTINRNTTLDDPEGETFGFQVAIVNGDQGGQLRAGGMAHDKNAIWVPAILPNVVMHPMDRLGHVAKGKGIPPFLILHVADHPDTSAQAQRLEAVLKDARVPAERFAAKETNHSKLNEDLGLQDDPPTQALFDFVSEVLSR